MKKLLILLPVLALLSPQSSDGVTRSNSSNSLVGVRISLTDGNGYAEQSGSLYQDGEAIGFMLETDTEAYVAVFNIDTEGFVHLLYPSNANNLQKVSPRELVRLPEDSRDMFHVGGANGMEFVFAVAVKDKSDFSKQEFTYMLDNDNKSRDRQFRVDGDPFLAANRVIKQFVRTKDENVKVGYGYFYVGQTVDYPRYMCVDCYQTGRDPYGPDANIGMVASTTFDRESGFTYPLAAGYYDPNQRTVAKSEPVDGYGVVPPQVTNVYYVEPTYPRYGYGFYDPWYWPFYGPVYCGPVYNGYPSGIYIGVSWGWGGSYYNPYYGGHYYGGTVVAGGGLDQRTLRLRGTRTKGVVVAGNTGGTRYKGAGGESTGTTRDKRGFRPTGKTSAGGGAGVTNTVTRGTTTYSPRGAIANAKTRKTYSPRQKTVRTKQRVYGTTSTTQRYRSTTTGRYTTRKRTSSSPTRTYGTSSKTATRGTSPGYRTRTLTSSRPSVSGRSKSSSAYRGKSSGAKSTRSKPRARSGGRSTRSKR